MYARAEAPRYTEAEYLAIEAASDHKHEFIDGRIIAVAGGRPAHNLIAAQLIRALGNRLEGHPCAVFTGDQQICVSARGDYLYPDVSVVCPPFETRNAAFTAPRVIVEVISASTEDHDRGFKLHRYQSLPLVTDVLLVEQSTRQVEHHTRRGADEWTRRVLTDGAVALRGLEVELPLDEIYRGVDALPD